MQPPKMRGKASFIQQVSGTSFPLTFNLVSDIVMFTGTSVWNCYGLRGGYSGRRITIKNESTNGSVIQFINNNTAAEFGTRLNVPDSQSYTMQPGNTAEFVYDESTRLWDFVSYKLLATSPLVITNHAMSAPNATSGSAGFLSAADYSQFSQRIQAGSGLGTSYGVPFYSTTGLNPPILYSDGSVFGFDLTAQRLAIGLYANNAEGTVHAASTIPTTIAEPSFAATLQPSPVVATPNSSSAVKTTPDIARWLDAGTFATNLGSGSYNAADLINLEITPVYDDGGGNFTAGVAKSQIIGITDLLNTFDISISLAAIGAENFGTNILSIAREINGGGYLDYQRFSTSTTIDNNVGWISGTDSFTSTADDFLADGSLNSTFDYYGKALDPNSNDLYSPSFDTVAFFDGATGESYKISHSGNCTATDVKIILTGVNAKIVSSGGTFSLTQGPATFVDNTTTTPNTFGYLSNGSNLNLDYTLFNYDSTLGIYSPVGVNQVITDSNDGLYYYVQLDGSAPSTSGKIVKNTNGTGLITATSFTLLDDGVLSFPNGSTSTPNSALVPAIIGQSDGTYQIAVKSLSGSTQGIGFFHSSGVMTSRILGDNAGLDIETMRYLRFIGVSSAVIPNNSLFQNAATGKLSFKDNSGTVNALY